MCKLLLQQLFVFKLHQIVTCSVHRHASHIPECSRSPGTHQDIWHLDCNFVYKSTVLIASKRFLNSCSNSDLSLPAASDLINDHHMYMVASAVSIS